LINHYFTKQFVGFLIVGIVAASLHWLARYILSFWFNFPVAVSLSYIIGILVAFELNRRFIFAYSKRNYYFQARDFILTNIAFFPVVWVSSIYFRSLLIRYEITQYSDGIAHGGAIMLPMLITFLIYKFVAFR
tara:strand:+ start:783 stop:1181 length:399 start_codon:yes stop_codon:yes gene_type:complete